MSGEIDAYIDSDSFTDRGLLSLLKAGKSPSPLTLMRYLSRCFVHPRTIYRPESTTAKELLKAGAVPFHYEERFDWEELFMDDARLYMPSPLRSTLNIATLIDHNEIIRTLIDAGERPNSHTDFFTPLREGE